MRKSARTYLTRSSFSGGTIKALDLPTLRFKLADGPAAFEDGTINYLGLSAIAPALDFYRPLISAVSIRGQALISYLWTTLPTIVYDDEFATPLVEIRGPPPGPERGATLSLLFYKPRDAHKALESYRFVVWAAARQGISVRG